jgi:signal transduction histidine kinase
VDKARARAAGGAGLGLSIAQWAVAINGGAIEVECDPGPGSIFRIRLPNNG